MVHASVVYGLCVAIAYGMCLQVAMIIGTCKVGGRRVSGICMGTCTLLYETVFLKAMGNVSVKL